MTKPNPGLAASLPAADFQHLRVSRRYVVTAPFTDHDGGHHPAGEAWTFLTHNFLPYEDGLSLYVTPDGAREVQIRLKWTSEAQGAVIDSLAQHVQPAAAPGDARSDEGDP